MLTLFGKIVRKLRIDNGELLKDMAEKLGVTSSYLSAVENGKRNIPQEWPDAISKIYSLGRSEQKELMEAARESQLTMKVDLNGYDAAEKNLIMALARELKDLDDENKSKIQEILRSNKKRR